MHSPLSPGSAALPPLVVERASLVQSLFPTSCSIILHGVTLCPLTFKLTTFSTPNLVFSLHLPRQNHRAEPARSHRPVNGTVFASTRHPAYALSHLKRCKLFSGPTSRSPLPTNGTSHCHQASAALAIKEITQKAPSSLPTPPAAPAAPACSWVRRNACPRGVQGWPVRGRSRPMPAASPSRLPLH